MVETFLIKCSHFLCVPVSQRRTLKLITCQNFLEIEKVRSSDFNPTNPIEVILVGQNQIMHFDNSNIQSLESIDSKISKEVLSKSLAV